MLKTFFYLKKNVCQNLHVVYFFVIINLRVIQLQQVRGSGPINYYFNLLKRTNPKINKGRDYCYRIQPE